jgi:hypothetical protein
MAVYDSRGGGSVHIDVALTNVSVGWPNDGLVGDVLAPAVTITKQSNKYYIYGREAWGLEPGGDLRSPGSVATEIPGLLMSTDTYFAQEHALQIPVTDEERENVDSPFTPDADGTELVTSKLMIQREINLKTLVLTAANYPAGHTTTLSGTAQWSDYVNSDPIANIKTGKRAINADIFLDPNVIVFPYQVMSQLEDHPDFIERIKYSERGVLTKDIIAAVIGIPNVVVPGVGYNSANPGQAVSLGYLWGKDVLMAYVPPRPGLKIPAFAYEFVWSFGGGQRQIVDRWREEPRASDLIRVRRRYQFKLTALDGSSKSIAGYLIKAAVA